MSRSTRTNRITRPAGDVTCLDSGKWISRREAHVVKIKRKNLWGDDRDYFDGNDVLTLHFLSEQRAANWFARNDHYIKCRDMQILRQAKRSIEARIKGIESRARETTDNKPRAFSRGQISGLSEALKIIKSEMNNEYKSR